MAEAATGGGLLDLEKELTCSICTETLYQPLTLLDCLHTFCGSCLKLWFAWQASSNSSRRANPYTCPSCRASVRATRPDAKITTLLEMYLQANPGKGKTTEEKEDVATKYKPGDDVIPRTTVRPEDIDDDDRRMVEEVRDMSLRDNASGRTRDYARGTRHRPRSRDDRHDDRESDSDSRAQARQVEHQSSLRSLISSSDVDADVVDEIVRQIAEEGLLDGIDVNNLNPTEEDQLSERIADAYRRRYHQRSREQSRRRDDSRRRQAQPTTSAPTSAPNSQSNRRHARSTSTADHPATSSHPPISRPHLFEAYPVGQGQRHHRRTSSETRRRQHSPVSGASAGHEATRSATDLSQRPRMTEARERRPSDLQTQVRRATDPRPRRMSENSRTNSNGPSAVNELRRRDSPRGTGSPLLSPTLNHASPTQVESPPSTIRSPRMAPTSSPRTAVATLAAQEASNSRPSSSSSTNHRSRQSVFPEPSITCDACGKTDIQYDLHANCAVCNGGRWNLCHHCYRAGKGCKHYFGFGNAAWWRFQQRSDAGPELPHTLVGARYQRPPEDTLQNATAPLFSHSSTADSSSTARTLVTTDNPANRYLSGAFCSICHNYANDCFWYCDTCNDGEWGYCSTCVNTGRVCTHSLLPLAHVSAPLNTPATPPANPSAAPQSTHTFATLSSPNMLQPYPPSNLRASGQMRPLTFSITCSACSYPIAPSSGRYHCYQCADGDYDICTTCYAKFCDSGRISRDNGDKGWRRCLRGHRMVVVFFEDTDRGQKRVIVRDLVGGLFLKEDGEDGVGTGPGSPRKEERTYRWLEGGERKTRDVSLGTNSRGDPSGRKFPPDGGVGKRLLARWMWLPAEGVKDELGFPRGAEIREALEISNEWYLGSYAGAKGMFPANHVQVIDVVTM